MDVILYNIGVILFNVVGTIGLIFIGLGALTCIIMHILER